MKFIEKIFGSRNDRLVKQMQKTVQQINALEDKMSPCTDQQLQDKTAEFRQRLEQGETLDVLLPEAFAVVREAGKRALNMRHFDVQLIGGMVLHQGKITEMRTGEGKTLVATLAVYLNALPAKGVHVVTVNDYLAVRDSEWMGKLYNFLGLSVGVIVSGQDADAKRQAYAADITYGTNNEYGFDYLRDNMSFSDEERVQRVAYFAVVDEVDSILIDEARTPLIISGSADDSSELYRKINALVPQLKRQETEDGPGDYSIDEKDKKALLSEEGHDTVERLMQEMGLVEEGSTLYDTRNISLLHHVDAALRAHALFKKDVDYIVADGNVVIVDEFTGRTLAGRRWSDGLHQAVEAKEGVNIQSESQTLASITFQNYFRLYDTLSGMTGTADTEAYEFQQIYSLEVVVIPTHRVMVRDDMSDLVFMTAREKFDAIIEDIKDCKERKQPVLVGTASIDTSEYLSDLLDKADIKHEVLNAKQHEREAHIIAHAGRLGSITIATNMAGRGTDIVLGGNLDAARQALKDPSAAQLEELQQEWQQNHDAVLACGGLHIIGTERHESRRIDNQLRGRSGRQGDVGSSRFYLSLEDNLMRIFASDRVAKLMQKLGMQEGEAIEHSWVSKAIENAQRKVEGHNFDIRKQLLDYDDVANMQRKEIYAQRNEIMASEDLGEMITVLRHDVMNGVISDHMAPGSMDEQWDLEGLENTLKNRFVLDFPIQQWMQNDDDLHEETLRDKIIEQEEQVYIKKEAIAGAEAMRHFEKMAFLQVLDSLWKEHLSTMDHLRQGIHLRGYGQKNPKQEYKREAFEMFSELLERIKYEVVRVLSVAQVRSDEDIEAMEEQRRQQSGGIEYQHEAAASTYGNAHSAGQAEGQQEEVAQPFRREGQKIGRNKPCPCGSGKKYKHCHGKIS